MAMGEEDEEGEGMGDQLLPLVLILFIASS
jgi:hypothetical protein